MKLSIRGKLFVLTLGFIAIVDLLVGIYLENELREGMERATRSELVRHAQAARELLASPGEVSVQGADAIADRASVATEARITVITEDGEVIGDSEIDTASLRTVENHANRPEFTEALASGHGVASRTSDTVGWRMLYAAVPLQRDDGRYVVRAAVPLQRIEEAVARMRMAVAVAGLLSLVVASVLLVLISKLVSNTLRTVISAAQAAVSGDQLPARDDDAVVGSIHRLTADLESTMQALAAERNRFQAVLETMDQAVLALDANGRISTVNRAARSLLGLRSNVEGLKLVEAVRIPALKQLVEQAQVGEAHAAEFEIPGGRRVEARATAQADGGVVVAVLDVTEIRRLERVRRDFVANVSHELRTPISVIRANTETLLAGALEDTERGRTFIDAVNRHAERLGRLVSDLLDISRIEAGRYPLNFQRVAVADAVDNVLDMLEVEASSKNIELSAEIDPALELVADKKALDQVLVNLVTNAIKYTPAGGHVEVDARVVDGRVRVEVLDDGPGIDPAHRQRIFERFYRVDPGRSRDMGGTGLGLSIVKHLLEAMEGEVGVDPRSPKGSRFWFTLAAPHQAARATGEDHPPAGRGSGRPGAGSERTAGAG